MLQNLTTIKKVGLGFATLTLILIVSVLLTIWQVTRTQAVTHQLVNVQAPMSEGCFRLSTGIYHSLAGLRGWMLLADEQFKSDRAQAWSKRIEPALEQVKTHVKQTGNTSWEELVTSIEATLGDLRKSQNEIEALVHTPQNFPATQMLTNEAVPKASIVTAAITSMIDVENSTEASQERRALLIQMANFRSSFGLSQSSIRSYLMLGDTTFVDEYRTHWETNQQAYEGIDQQNSLFTPEQKNEWKKLQTARAAFEQLPEKMFAIRASLDWNLANTKLRDESAAYAFTTQTSLDRLLSEISSQVDANRERVVALTAYLVALEWILLTIGVLFSGIVAALIIRNVKLSIDSVLRATQEVAAASTEIASAAQQQVTSLNETASSLNEITSTSEQFKATVQEFADRARAVQEAADETVKLTDDGRVLTLDSSSRIDQVRSNSQAAGESVLNLAEQMQRIGEITASVNEIAEQTKLLALNASIEAARAGEEGRGFAVVATQVRELANQSKESAGRIESLITETQKSMHDVIKRIEDGARLSDEASEIVSRMTQSFGSISEAIEQTTQAMNQINTGAQQQEQAISELVSGISEIDSASRESLASAEQTQKSILAIDAEMQRLNQVMKTF
jgi:methyl-accepting chemotaxis protein